MLVTNGCDPNWARDVLVGIMAPYWVCLAKNETAMESALAQVCQFRDEIIPKLRATDGHGLRLCHEMKHKALIAEAKLRASLGVGGGSPHLPYREAIKEKAAKERSEP